MKKRRILFLAEGRKFNELAVLAQKIGFESFTRKSWLEGGKPYKDEDGKDFFQCLVSDKGDPVSAFTMAFPKARLLTSGYEFRSRAGFELQLAGMQWNL